MNPANCEIEPLRMPVSAAGGAYAQHQLLKGIAKPFSPCFGSVATPAKG
jgi:hypothetical protein